MPIITFREHTGAVRALDFSPDGKQIASAGGDKMVRIWDAATGREIRSLTGHFLAIWSVAFSPDGKRLASAGLDTTVRVWDVAGGKTELTLKGEHDDLISRVLFSPDGKRIASASFDGTVRVWDATTGRVNVTISIPTPVCSAAFSPDGRRIALASLAGTVTIYDVVTTKLVDTTWRLSHTDAVFSVAFRPNPKADLLASASADKTVKIWTTDKYRPSDLLAHWRLARTHETHTDAVVCVTFSPDGNLLASSGCDKTIEVSRAESGERVLIIRGHSEKCFTVAFSPDSKRLASASQDNTVKIWDLPGLKEKQ